MSQSAAEIRLQIKTLNEELEVIVNSCEHKFNPEDFVENSYAGGAMTCLLCGQIIVHGDCN